MKVETTKSIKKIRGHTNLARFLAQTEETGLEVPRVLRSPYTSSPTHIVRKYRESLVIVVELGHAYHEVFLVK